MAVVTGGTHTLTVHLGLPKTASTWLQRQVFPRLDHLEVRTTPRTSLFGTRADHEADRRLFACALRRAPAVWDAMGDDILVELLGERATWLRAPRDVLISDEAIGRAASRPDALARHLDGLRRTAALWGFGRLALIVFVRRQDAWLASHSAQISDRKPFVGQADFEALVRRVLDPGADRYGFGMILDHFALHEALTRAVDPRDILIVPHERLGEAPQATLTHLLSWIGTGDAHARSIAAEAARRAENVRAREDGGDASWRLRPPSLPLPGVSWRWQIPAPLWPRRQITLTPALSRQILAAFEGRNRALSRLAGLDLGRHGYFPDADTPEGPTPEGLERGGEI